MLKVDKRKKKKKKTWSCSTEMFLVSEVLYFGAAGRDTVVLAVSVL